ncbi:hypothetical protein [Streptomyces tubercidicus]|uniref:hypothetical protein n=1 Tax=Streptomyces tubercidicus TaxID=47759 RepID=UPI0036C445B0
MSEKDRSFVTVMSTALGPKGAAAYAGLMRTPLLSSVRTPALRNDLATAMHMQFLVK